MATASIWSSRSRHATNSVHSHRSHKSPTRSKKKDAEAEVVEKPDIDELRRRRSAYYSVPAEQRRRGSKMTPSTSKSKLKHVKSSTSRSSVDRSRKSKHKSSSATIGTQASKAERHLSESERRTDEFVYGPSRTEAPGLQPSLPGAGVHVYNWSKSERRPLRHSGSSSHRSLSTLVETELTPDDSVSQVAERTYSPSRGVQSSTRPALRRNNTTSRKLPSISETPNGSPSGTVRRRSNNVEPSLLGSMFRRHSTTSVPTPPRLVDCLTCGSDDVPSTQSAKLECGHRMCRDCLKRVFELSVKDPAHMPPKCCTDKHIPLKHVDKLFDVKFKILWNRKYQEYNTKNRIYCPTAKCGEWIKPSHIHKDQGRKYALCPRCKTKVCTLCNNKYHKSRDCPKDPEIAKLVEQAKEEGWQRCFSCHAMVERKEGCHHMTCRCTAEFCMVCGSKWKTCDCPWFNYADFPNPDRLNEMRVPEPIQVVLQQVFRAVQDPPRLPVARPAPISPRLPRNRPPPPEVTYQQELEHRQRQERLDADLARRLQLASLIDGDDAIPRGQQANDEAWGLGNVAGHFMNDDFVQNAANVVMDTFGDANLGRRGERISGRRRRARQTDQNEGDIGLVPNFLGDESVLGAGPPARSR